MPLGHKSLYFNSSGNCGEQKMLLLCHSQPGQTSGALARELRQRARAPRSEG